LTRAGVKSFDNDGQTCNSAFARNESKAVAMRWRKGANEQ